MSICKICFNDFSYRGVNLFNKKLCLCSTCFNSLDISFKTFKDNDLKITYIYEYDEFFKSLLFQFKGQYDYELKDCFLSYFYNELSLRYKNYILIPLPSTKSSDEERKYNHVIEIYKILNLEIKPLLYKKEDFKQSDLNKEDRLKIISKLGLIEDKSIRNKNVLIIDDVYTTGSSIKAAYKLIKRLQPKKIEALVLSKVKKH